MSEASQEDLSNFERLLGRAATVAEREQLLRVKAAMGLKDNDALWLILFALQYYEGLYRQFPKAIAEEARRVLGETRTAADAAIRASAEAGKADLAAAKAELAKAIASAAREAARDAARKQLVQWLVVGMVVGVLLFASGVWVGQRA